ncbi:hypothetical protein SDC9_161354 [bioreactor metagenome]|uniref:Uncharacterized protein n=1 Tax=bioreactor metagenome TaxID=1076179 RepID=A0A645FHZ9_9ZZZZ
MLRLFVNLQQLTTDRKDLDMFRAKILQKDLIYNEVNNELY